MKKILFILWCVVLFGDHILVAQEYNKTDSKGRRQGLWTDFYPNGQKRYEGKFKNDKCTGEFKYYDEKGNLKATNVFDKTGTKATNKTYAPNGTMVATGTYLNQKKEGEWRYYSEENGTLLLVEENHEGQPHGNSTLYYETGVVMMERKFCKGLLEGHSKTYYPSGALKEEGDYRQGNKAGVWKAYNQDGDIVSTENFTAPELQGFER